jgi:NAD(P)-dependent dehydrogenase (short-subunit alcohol dehydrogenase family)
VRELAQEGYRVGMFARSPGFISELADELGANTLAVPTNVSDAKQIAAGFRKVRQQLGPVEILIAHASDSLCEGLMNTTPDQFERSWHIAVMGAFFCAREAVPDMLKLATGRVRPTGGRGATSSVRGRGGAVAFSSAKFAVRGLAQSLAVELWPKGIHVAHVIIDGVIDTPDVPRHTTVSQRTIAPARGDRRFVLESNPARPERMEFGNRFATAQRGVL